MDRDDLDHVKEINDFHGHDAGDLALSRVADEAQRILRRRDLDVFARLGGDEFAMLLAHTTLDGAHAVAERIRLGVEALLPTPPVPLTISIGVAACPDHGQSTDALMRAADAALYLAKRTRNTVAVAC